MSKPIAVLMNWIHMPATEMAAFAHNTSAKMNGNPNFPKPDVPYADMDAAADRLELAYANRMNGDAAKTEYENADEALDTLLHQQAAYVNGIANGDAAIIESAGFVTTAQSRKKAVVPAVPDAPQISGNAPGLHLQIPAVTGAKTYCWVIFTTGDKSTATVAATHIVLPEAAIVIPDGATRETLRGVIAAGTTITVQVLAQNAAGKSGFSTQVSFTVGS